MSERIFSELTKTVDTEPGQSAVLGPGATINYDVSLAGYAPPFSVQVLPPNGLGSLTREILGFVGDQEVVIEAAAGVPLGTPLKNDYTDLPYTRIRVRLVAGTPPPNQRVLVQVNGISVR